MKNYLVEIDDGEYSHVIKIKAENVVQVGETGKVIIADNVTIDFESSGMCITSIKEEGENA